MDFSLPLTILFSLFYFSSLFVFNVKSFLLLFILIFLFLFFIFKFDIFHSSLTTLILSLPFENSIRQWALYSPGAEVLNSYTFFFGITPKLVLFFLTLGLFLVHNRPPTISNNKPTTWLLVFFTITSIVSLTFDNRLVFVGTGYLRIAMAVGFFFFGQYLITNSPWPKILTAFLISLTLFNTTIGFWQLVQQKSLGKYIELTPSFSRSGYQTTDGVSQFRVSGTISHPTFFGSFMSLMLPLIISIGIQYPLLLGLTPFVISAILGTLSRSTWINLALTFTLFTLYLRHYLNISQLTSHLQKYWRVVLFFAVVVAYFILPPILTRSESLSDLLTNPEGSLYARLNINRNSFQISQAHPLVGAGLNNFAFLSYIYGYSNIFSAPPHSTVLIFLAELGIPATIAFAAFLITLLWPRSNPFGYPPLTFGLWIGLITFVISSQFHPLFNLDPTFELFMLTAGIFTGLCHDPLKKIK